MDGDELKQTVKERYGRAALRAGGGERGSCGRTGSCGCDPVSSNLYDPADTAAVKAHFEAAHAAMGKAHWLALVSAVQAKVVLNEAQRTKVQAWTDSMQTWMEQHHRMMKPRESH